jgi:hypothetical protein
MTWHGTIRSVKRILDGWIEPIDWESVSVGGEIVVTLLAGHGRCPCGEEMPSERR